MQCQDEILCGLLKKFSRRPWDKFLLSMVLDRRLDLGQENRHQWEPAVRVHDHFFLLRIHAKMNRRSMARELRRQRHYLEEHYGYFETDPDIPF